MLPCVASGAEQDYKVFAIYSLWTEMGGETGLLTVMMERCPKAHLKKKPLSHCLVRSGQL